MTLEKPHVMSCLATVALGCWDPVHAVLLSCGPALARARLQQVLTDARHGEGLGPPQEVRATWPHSVDPRLVARSTG